MWSTVSFKFFILSHPFHFINLYLVILNSKLYLFHTIFLHLFFLFLSLFPMGCVLPYNDYVHEEDISQSFCLVSLVFSYHEKTCSASRDMTHDTHAYAYIHRIRSG